MLRLDFAVEIVFREKDYDYGFRAGSPGWSIILFLDKPGLSTKKSGTL